MLTIDYSKFAKYGKLIHTINILLLLGTLILGSETKGAQAWIELGPFKFQPAEVAKTLLILGLAQFLVPRIGKLKTFKELLPVFIYVAIPLLLILKQPDLGTGLVYVAIMFGMLLAAGASPGLLFLLVGSGIGLIALAIYGHFAWGWWLPLENYQINRLIVFIDPMIDPRDSGWHVIQSQIAVGSGGLWGKGWGWVLRISMIFYLNSGQILFLCSGRGIWLCWLCIYALVVFLFNLSWDYDCP